MSDNSEDRDLRLNVLGLALQGNPGALTDGVVARAKAFYKFVSKDPKDDEEVPPVLGVSEAREVWRDHDL